MNEYTGNGVRAFYFNKVVYNTYLTDKERAIIDALDYMRYDTLKNEKKDFPHLSWTTEPAKDYEVTNLFYRFFLIMIDCMEHTTELYAEENKDNPEKVMQDLKESLKGITAKAFCDEIITKATYGSGKNPYTYNPDTQKSDFSLIKRDLEHICEPMIKALEQGNHQEELKKAKAAVKRKATAIGKYAMEKGI